jgi:hypothetical protein
MITIHFQCKECGAPLQREAIKVEQGIDIELSLAMTPCTACRERAVNAAYDEGRDDGLEGYCS